MKRTLKTSALLLGLMAAVSYTTAQPHPEARMRTVPFEEWSANYPTVDDKGKLLNAVHISELQVDSKWCLPKPIRLSFDSKEGKVWRNAGWYVWHPVRKYWMKTGMPGYSSYKDGAKGGMYSVGVTCPGVYGLFYSPPAGTEGVCFKAPLFHRIKSLSLRQEHPGIAVAYVPEEPLPSIHVPTDGLGFSAQVEAVLVAPDGKEYAVNPRCLGSMTDLPDEGKAKKRIVVALRKSPVKASTEEGATSLRIK